MPHFQTHLHVEAHFGIEIFKLRSGENCGPSMGSGQSWKWLNYGTILYGLPAWKVSIPQSASQNQKEWYVWWLYNVETKLHCSDIIISLKSHMCLSFSVINPVAEWKEIQRFTSLNHHFITLLLTGSKDEERPVSSQMDANGKEIVTRSLEVDNLGQVGQVQRNPKFCQEGSPERRAPQRTGTLVRCQVLEGKDGQELKPFQTWEFENQKQPWQDMTSAFQCSPRSSLLPNL